MAQLQPASQYPLIYQVFPDDPATYYIQAVIRVSNTGKVWQTVNLTNSGGNRYVGFYTTPQDGFSGVPIDITYYVYTDSGHTTLSQQYDTRNTEHFVLGLFTPSMGYSGGNDSLSKEDIAQIIRAEMRGQKPPKELSIDEEQVKFLKIFEPLGSSLHHSLMGIYDKHDQLEKGLKEIKGSQGRNKKRLFQSQKEMMDFVKQITENTKAENEKLIRQLIEENSTLLSAGLSTHVENINDKLSKHFNGKTEELIKLIEKKQEDKEKMITDNYQEYGKKIKKNFIRMIEEEPIQLSSEDLSPKNKPVDYLFKAKKLLSV